MGRSRTRGRDRWRPGEKRGGREIEGLHEDGRRIGMEELREERMREEDPEIEERRREGRGEKD